MEQAAKGLISRETSARDYVVRTSGLHKLPPVEEKIKVEVVLSNVKRIEPGFGPIFSDTRIHLQHMIPEMKANLPDWEIRVRYPTLKTIHVQMFREYYLTHMEEVLAKDAELTARTEERIREQRLKFPPIQETLEEKKARMRKILQERKANEAKLSSQTIEPLLAIPMEIA